MRPDRPAALPAAAVVRRVLRRAGSLPWSGRPAQEIDQQADADVLAFFHVELGARSVARDNNDRNDATVVGGGNRLRRRAMHA